MLQIPLELQLDDSARFENYFPDGNRQLYEKLSSLTHDTDDFLYIWGEQNTGKSHLAQAICQRYSKYDRQAIYLPLNNRVLKPEILDGLELFDLICIDGLESTAGDPDWEIAIFNLFNRLKEHNKQLIVFSRLSANNIPIILPDLVSRLNSMEVYLLNRLDDEKRLGFIVSTGKHRGLEISQDVAQFILVRTDRDIQHLVDLIKLLDKQSLAHQRKITIPFIKTVLDL